MPPQEQPVRLSVVVAAYNEEPVIGRNLPRIVAELAKRPEADWELILVNDGSRDHTGPLMDAFAAGQPRVRVLHHRRNFAQGRALRTGFGAARGQVIVTLDADLSYGPEYIAELESSLQSNSVEIALASPYAKGGTVKQVPFYRHVLSRLGNLYLARMTHYRISTSTCVVRAYSREVLDELVLTSDGMELQLEVLMKAALLGFTVCEVPAHLEWTDQKAAEGGFNRASKMRILRTIRLYLILGWIQRPASVFLLAAFLLLLPGFYMALALCWRLLQMTSAHLGKGVMTAISAGLEELFRTYTYSVVFSAAFLIIGLQLLAFALLVMQSKFYFEELYRLGISAYPRETQRIERSKERRS